MLDHDFSDFLLQERIYEEVKKCNIYPHRLVVICKIDFTSGFLYEPRITSCQTCYRTINSSETAAPLRPSERGSQKSLQPTSVTEIVRAWLCWLSGIRIPFTVSLSLWRFHHTHSALPWIQNRNVKYWTSWCSGQISCPILRWSGIEFSVRISASALRFFVIFLRPSSKIS
jgi:hypothetical protein